jgi:predicted adenylyl cyclase CyaB
MPEQILTINPFDLTKLGPFSEEEMTAMARAIYNKIDTPLRSSEQAPKRPLVEWFGPPKSYKTSATTEVEKFFRRNKFKTYCPPESAEHEDIRAETGENPIIFQAKHMNVVRDQYYLGENRDYHLTQVSRNLPDMLYWYEKGRRKGIYSERLAESAKESIYLLLQEDLIDISLFLYCSVEAAIEREYGQSVTQLRGSKMNEKNIAESLEIYDDVIEGLKVNVPNLPIFKIDTSKMTVKQAAEEALRYILPTLCVRYGIPDYSFMPYSLSLVQKRAQHTSYYEEQLKLYGHPKLDNVARAGWVKTKQNSQKDIYLKSVSGLPIDPWDEVLRLRWEDGSCKYMYKGTSKDRLLSHRQPHSFNVEDNEAERILSSFEQVATVEKERLNFKKDGMAGDGHFFTLHIDSVNGLGDFTEIRARGTDDNDHTRELLALAGELGFRTSDIVNGNYLSIALRMK